jgi:hypothetical protein
LRDLCRSGWTWSSIRPGSQHRLRSFCSVTAGWGGSGRTRRSSIKLDRLPALRRSGLGGLLQPLSRDVVGEGGGRRLDCRHPHPHPSPHCRQNGPPMLNQRVAQQAAGRLPRHHSPWGVLTDTLFGMSMAGRFGEIDDEDVTRGFRARMSFRYRQRQDGADGTGRSRLTRPGAPGPPFGAGRLVVGWHGRAGCNPSWLFQRPATLSHAEIGMWSASRREILICRHPGRLEADFAAGRLRCPGCDGVLQAWGYASPRTVRDVGSSSLSRRLRRSRCGSCGSTHLVPPGCCPAVATP